MTTHLRRVKRVLSQLHVEMLRYQGKLLGRRRELAIEKRLLIRAWEHRKPDRLQTYLVEGFQDPRIHPQSILTRYFLIRELLGDVFSNLIHYQIGQAREFAIGKDEGEAKNRELVRIAERHLPRRSSIATAH